jgi:hypothetical protein
LAKFDSIDETVLYGGKIKDVAQLIFNEIFATLGYMGNQTLSKYTVHKAKIIISLFI